MHHIMHYRFILTLLIAFACSPLWAQEVYQPQFSTAGFFELTDSGREVFSMNPAWKLYKGPLEGAEAVGFDDSAWRNVALPDGIEYLPTEASGCINYQGEVWYRKHFTPNGALSGKKLFLHFEGIMGKSKVFVNGQLLAEHFGGYLPVVVDVTEHLQFGMDNVIAVWADNSNDPNYPPGKPQETLDFSYFGGIYRDCWLVAHNNIFITDPNFAQETAGGGLFVAYDHVSEASADVILQAQVKNESGQRFVGVVEYVLQHPNGEQVALLNDVIRVKAGESVVSKDIITLEKPTLWSPENPVLYDLTVCIRNADGEIIDGFVQHIGIRSFEFKGNLGFWLNGKPYAGKLIGANRHQDFAVVGNAVPNSVHWRDAKKLRDAGLKVIRNAHCPQDPAFMDACDQLGLLVIVNTPGWQFWNQDPIFAQRVYEDIRNLVRRDRNHPSVWLWEPILNETHYPADFAKNVLDIVHQEYPYPYCQAACDSEARGSEYYTVLFKHPDQNLGQPGAAAPPAVDQTAPARLAADAHITYFTREWGDNVDDWTSHNSTSRVARNWGEQAMLIQAQHYASPSYPFTSYDLLHRTDLQHIGGCLWHSFDHQRGYHPDPFYGGLMDVFRQPKYSYYMFKAQRAPILEDRPFETGPMVYIAHEMTPFSAKDVTVYSNCEEVRLTFCKDGEVMTYTKPATAEGIPSPIITFPDAYDFMEDKARSRKQKQSEVFLLAEGLINGEVVATHEVRPSRRPEKLRLWVDDDNVTLTADGSDIVTVVAAVADKDGNIKRLNNYYIKFEIEGEGRLLGGPDILANPAPVKWGTAPILVQSTRNPGTIKIKASVLFEGSQMPVTAELEFESTPTAHRLVVAE